MKKSSVNVDTPWIPVPIRFLRSKACASLSVHASKLLLDVLASMQSNGGRNGDISLTPSLMRKRGWTSRATLQAAIQELLDANLLSLTRQGSRFSTSLFACTLYSISCSFDKLDIRQGNYSRHDYGGPNGCLAKEPTNDQPAKWKVVRKNIFRCPAEVD
jgi:hypothetical protein